MTCVVSASTIHYSFVHLTDTQMLDQYYPEGIVATINYIESINLSKNITAIIYTGDVVNNPFGPEPFKNYVQAKTQTTVPFYEIAGNHDFSYNLDNSINWSYVDWTNYDTYIGPAKHNYTITINDFVLIGAGYDTDFFGADAATLKMFKNAINNNALKMPIFFTHYYMSDSGMSYSKFGSQIQSSMIFRPSLILCGHYHGNILQYQLYNGSRVIESLENYQDSGSPIGNFGGFGLYEVTSTNNTIISITRTEIMTYPTFIYGPPQLVYLDPSYPPPPVANFSAIPERGVTPLSVTFNDTSSGTPNSWNWSFGDGSTSTTQNPVHLYTIPENYTVSLTVSNADQSNTSVRANYIIVNPLVPTVANFISNVTSGKVPLTVQFNDTSSGTPKSWNWSFGDGSTSTTQNPVHLYTIPENYTVSLTVSNADQSNTSVRANYIIVNPLVPDNYRFHHCT